jgi:hypothetical protein
MSAVHDDIAMQALAVQPERIKLQFENHIKEFKDSSWYPDVFADRAMSAEKKYAIDADADRFIYPLPPETELQKKLICLAERKYAHTSIGSAPPSQIYLIEFYLNGAIESLRQGDTKSAIKLCAVYSHVIADTGEPIHAMNPALLDIIVPPPEEFLGFELHANVEGLKAPVDITGYTPKLLGSNPAQAEMGAFAGLVAVHKFGAASVTPIVQALYDHDEEKARVISGLAQAESAKHFADFIFTVFSIAAGDLSSDSYTCDLCEYPSIDNSVDMLYRYQPIIDHSLIPYSGGKMVPLSLKDDNGDVCNVHGMGVIPSLGPPFSDEHIRNVDTTYYFVPGAYSNFTAQVGLNPLIPESMPTAKFTIIGDEEVLAESQVLSPGDTAETITAELDDFRFLTLRMSYVDTPPFEQLECVSTHIGWASHGVWGETMLLM